MTSHRIIVSDAERSWVKFQWIASAKVVRDFHCIVKWLIRAKKLNYIETLCQSKIYVTKTKIFTLFCYENSKITTSLIWFKTRSHEIKRYDNAPCFFASRFKTYTKSRNVVCWYEPGWVLCYDWLMKNTSSNRSENSYESQRLKWEGF